MSDLVHVSLFSGVGGIDIAMREAGIPTHAACEIDKHALGVLAARFPGTHLYTDVKDVTGDSLRSLGLNPRRTVASAGFPCTDLSVAGGRRGMGHGTRSGLYWEVDRILGEFTPAWVVLENVPGLLSAACACPGDDTCVDRGLAVRCDGETHAVPGGACWGECIARHGGVMGAVLGSLAERGYGFAYRVLDARYFGVPQRRRRVVIVGRLGDDGSAPAQVLLEPEGLLGNPAEGITPRPLFARRTGAGIADGGRPTAVTLMARGNPSYDPELENYAVGVLGTQAHTLTAEGHDASEDGTGRGVAYTADQVSTLQAGGGDRGYRVDAEGAAGGHLVATFQKIIRSGARDADGNLPPEVWAERDIAATLNLNDLGSESRVVEVAVHLDHPRLVVRRLTPLECERLQGFPDDHTAASNGKPQADSPRYRQMGNAVPVPMLTWVARRLVAVDDHLRMTKAVAS